MAAKTTARDKLDKRPAQAALARRLRELRVVNGFKTARSFAEHVGIDENRYTRYERAEVEPDITLIRLFAAALKTSPSDLLGTRTTDGFAEEAASGLGPTASIASGLRVTAAQTLAWSLAEAATDARSASLPSTPDARWRRLRSISTLYERLSADPLGTVAALMQDPTITDADAAVLGRIEDLIASLRRASTMG